MRSATLTGLGGLLAAFLGSLCCVGPLVFVTFGVGAGLASTFEPLRPLFGVLMSGLLAAGFWSVYGRRRVPTAASAPAGATSATYDPEYAPDVATCAVPARRGRDVAILWAATVVALVFWTFPTWSRWLV